MFSLDCPERGNGVKYALCLNLKLYSKFFIQSNSMVQRVFKKFILFTVFNVEIIRIEKQPNFTLFFLKSLLITFE